MSSCRPMDATRQTSVLFLCTGNSARSILAEFLLRHLGGSRFEVASAGSHPKGEVHPLALAVLRESFGIESTGARSKSWDELLDRRFDVVITLCGDAEQACPVWPGSPRREHWGLPDPAAIDVRTSPGAARAAFEATAGEILARCQVLVDELVEET
jgi:arsenate reductase (thioredoxin)